MRSPRRPPRVEAMPRSLTRKRWPDCVPGGIRTLTGPSRPLHFHPGAERRFVHADRHDHVQVVAVAAEVGIGGDVHGDVEVAGGAPARPRVPFARHAHPLPVANARRQPQGDAFGAHFVSRAGARRTRTRRLLAGAAARVAASREHHVPAHRAHRSMPLAQAARRRGHARDAGAAARAAGLAPRHRQRPLAAVEALVERESALPDGDRRLAAAAGRFAPCSSSTSANEIAERGRVVRSARGEVEPLESARGAPRRAPPSRPSRTASRRSRSISVSYASTTCWKCAAAA